MRLNDPQPHIRDLVWRAVVLMGFLEMTRNSRVGWSKYALPDLRLWDCVEELYYDSL